MSQGKKTRAVILAAGKGTRMQSDLPKVLHPVMGQPMVVHAVRAARIATGEKPVLVVGHKADEVMAVVGDQADYVLQLQRLGTGHAVQQAEEFLSGIADLVLVCYGDMPLLKSETLKRLETVQRSSTGPLTMLTVIAEDPRGFGRILRGDDDNVLAIIEEVDATPAQLTINELNVGVYCFDSDWLWGHLKHVPLSPKGEYYLTDLVGIAVAEGSAVQAIIVKDSLEVIGVNTLAHLAEAEAAMVQRSVDL